MYQFPEGLYSDVRVERATSTTITYIKGELRDSRQRETTGALIRVFDGKRWYYSAVTSLSSIQEELRRLAALAKPSADINAHPAVKKLSALKGTRLIEGSKDIRKTPREEKACLIQSFFDDLKTEKTIVLWSASYIDNHTHKDFYSSKGAVLSWETQVCGLVFGMQFAEGEKRLSESYQKAVEEFSLLEGLKEGLKVRIAQAVAFMREATRVTPGKYTIILSPLAAGIFAHESFGHKSEADFMLGDEAMKAEWTIGKRLGPDFVSIVDEGGLMGSGFTPYDDEGTPAHKTHLIKNGLLAGRLHNAETAAELREDTTGNARAVNFEFEPIVRMTTTYFEAGNMTKEELFAGVREGLFIDTINHGSGLSTYTLAPSMAYHIKDGKIGKPVQVSVISGNVFETFSLIDGISNKVELLSFVAGGCGKNAQYPLPVGFGGPYIRVRGLSAV